MVNVQSPTFAPVGTKVDLVILNREVPAEVKARHSDGDVLFKLVRGRDGNRHIRFVMPAADEVMVRVLGQSDGPRLVRVRRQA